MKREPIVLEQTLKFEVDQHDLPEAMTWKEAKQTFADLGDGWRLPTKDELNLMYINRVAIGGFANYYYWSSTEYNNYNAWRQHFNNGKQGYCSKDCAYLNVRVVRDIN